MIETKGADKKILFSLLMMMNAVYSVQTHAKPGIEALSYDNSFPMTLNGHLPPRTVLETENFKLDTDQVNKYLEDVFGKSASLIYFYPRSYTPANIWYQLTKGDSSSLARAIVFKVESSTVECFLVANSNTNNLELKECSSTVNFNGVRIQLQLSRYTDIK